jgi:hypothetical protein
MNDSLSRLTRPSEWTAGQASPGLPGVHGSIPNRSIPRPSPRELIAKLPEKAIKRDGRPELGVPDRLRSYRAAINAIRIEARQETGRWNNNRAESTATVPLLYLDEHVAQTRWLGRSGTRDFARRFGFSDSVRLRYQRSVTNPAVLSPGNESEADGTRKPVSR